MKKFLSVCLFIFSFSFVFAEESALSLYNKGKLLQNKGDYVGATNIFQETLISNPNYADAWFALAECSYELNEYTQCLSCIENAERILHDDINVERLKGFCYIGLGETEKAQKVFESILAKAPNDVETMFGLAQLKVFEGSFGSAEKYYLDALTRQSTNKKALLSLALVSLRLGKNEEARNFINQAIAYHSEESQVYYYASYVALQDGDIKQAEKYIQTAYKLDENSEQVNALYSYILFSEGKFDQTIAICNSRIKKNRNNSNAWYLKAVSCYRLNRIEEAIKALENTISINPQDELARSVLEYIVCENLPLEDKRRASYALYHARESKEAIEKFNSTSALLEFIRTLKIDPMNFDVRLAYADWLLDAGYPEYSLEQLKFIQNQGSVSQKVADRIEAYDSYLENNLSRKWGMDSLYVDKNRISIGFYYFAEKNSILHADSSKFCTMLLADTFDAYPYFKVSTEQKSIKTFSEAFRNARNFKYDYFAIVSFDENERENTIKVDLYSTKTGNKCNSWACYRTGNKKLQSCIQKISSSIVDSFGIRGKIINRKSNQVLVDLGSRDGISLDSEFLVIKKDFVRIADNGIGLTYDKDAELGTVTLTVVDEDLSEGVFKQLGYYDRMNVDDEVVLIKKDELETIRKDYNPNEMVQSLMISEFSSMLNSIR